ncbi:MAG: transglutaminase domain-containing protein [Planctomycetota bacterium]
MKILSDLRVLSTSLCLIALSGLASVSRAEQPDLEARLKLAGDNRAEIQRAIQASPQAQQEAMRFLVQFMPVADLRSLSAEYLLENVRLAYEAIETAPWGDSVPKEVFFNDVLPYASINERRDRWRADFRARCLPMIKGTKSPSEAVAKINQQLFQQVGVKYSTKRKKADQSPYESMESGLASCTGLSVILVDACRSVGIPARLVGTPLWWNNSGNHSWVEVWDDGWQFTGAAEPTGDSLNQGWFTASASKAVRDDPRKAIYATSFRTTPLHFPCVWAPQLKTIPAINVTDRYATQTEIPNGKVDALFVVRDETGTRISATLRITKVPEDEKATAVVIRSNDEGFDANDHRRVRLDSNQDYALTIVSDGFAPIQEQIKTATTEKLFPFVVAREATASNEDASSAAIDDLKAFLERPESEQVDASKQAFYSAPLTAADADAVREMLRQNRLQWVRKTRAKEMEERVLVQGNVRMPFDYKVFGEKPEGGRSLYISMHGGGGAPKAVNDRQWENQKRLYQPEEGVYVAPRAPTDTWNLWHQGHIDPLFVRLIENMVAFEDVRWDRVYLMGYSAGGDGVYQLAPRMSDRWAAAAMMAGHPNETSPLGLRNVPFALQMGGQDSAYKRNEIAVNWKLKLAELRSADPQGYEHFVKIYPQYGHWMNRDDAVAVPWMAKHTRNPVPDKVVWVQDDVLHHHFYWLGVDADQAKKGTQIVASIKGQEIEIESKTADAVTIYLDDRLVDLDQPVTVRSGEKTLFSGHVQRRIGDLLQQLESRADPALCFSARIDLRLQQDFPTSLVPSDKIPMYSAVHIDQPVVVDGKLDEDVWASSSKTSSFVDLVAGTKTRHETRSAVLWDDEYLYVGFWVDEPNVEAKYLNRDDPIYRDNDIEVFIAGKDAYYEFELNAHNTIYEGFFVWQDVYQRDNYSEEAQLRPDAPKKQAFNGVGLTDHPRGKRWAFLGYDFPGLKTAVHIDGTLNDDTDTDEGWTVELAFPWKGMRSLAKGDGRSLPPKPGDQWRINLFRFNTDKAPEPASDSGGWAFGKHGVWDSHVPEIFPIVTFEKPPLKGSDAGDSDRD